MSDNKNVEKLNKTDSLAQDVLKLSRNTLLVNLRFLDMALSQFEMIKLFDTLAVDGKHIFYNPIWLLQRYKVDKKQITRDYLHMVFHCVFHHAFVSTLVDKDYWDLACDIAVENAISELENPCLDVGTEQKQSSYILELKQNVKILSAEKIYNYYLESQISKNKIAEIREAFQSDDHFIWYLPPDKINSMVADNDNSKGNDKEAQNNFDNSEGNDEEVQNSFDNSQGQNDKSENQLSRRTAGFNSKELQQEWSDIAKRMQTDLETFSKQHGDKAGGMLKSLQAVTREKYDYSEFLKKFAVYGEAMKINDDEFDYIFYTYGIKLYSNMPLIEPLEYKDVKCIKEFVIAIDTSGSTSGELVQKFMNKTYNILKQTESFFTKINLHIIQCDAEIQEDVKITNQEEFDRYIKTLEIKGLGGTDFRPVFKYVNKLKDEREFVNLKGLIYFTDGYGTFPAHQPDYKTAFVFIDDEYDNPDVPVWAMKLVLQKDEI